MKNIEYDVKIKTGVGKVAKIMLIIQKIVQDNTKLFVQNYTIISA